MRQKHVSGGVSEAGPTRDLNVTLLQYAEYVNLELVEGVWRARYD